MTKQHIILDGSKIKSAQDFHKLMAELLDFGSYYGNNLNALWDMMSGGMGDNIILHWINSQYSKTTLGAACYEDIISLFDNVKKYDEQIVGLENGFDYILE